MANEVNAPDICAKHVDEGRERADAKKASLVAFLAAYPDIRDNLADMRAAGFDVTFNTVSFAVHSPMQQCADYPAVMESHTKGEKKRGR